MSDKRKYSKGNPEIQPYDKKQVSNSNLPHDTVHFTAISDYYRKTEPSIIPKSFFVIISGGEKREKDYFHLIDSNPDKFPQIKIEFIADSKRLNPNGMLEIAKEELVRYQSSETKDTPDDYFLLSDVDHFINDLRRIKPECEKLRLNLVVSNPCFEVWLYYSKRDDKFMGFEVPEKRLKISKAVKDFLPTKIKGGCNPIKAIFDIQNNIQNARKNYSEDMDGFPELFTTNMFILAEKILPLVSDGLILLHK